MPKTDAEKLPEIIAKCSRCGRGFVWVNPASDMIDHFAPANGSGVSANADCECGGTIALASSSEAGRESRTATKVCKPEW